MATSQGTHTHTHTPEKAVSHPPEANIDALIVAFAQEFMDDVAELPCQDGIFLDWQSHRELPKRVGTWKNIVIHS